MRPLANHNTPHPNSMIMIMVNESPLTPTRILVCLGSDPSPAWFGSGSGLVRIRMSVVRIPIPKSQAQAIGDGHGQVHGAWCIVHSLCGAVCVAPPPCIVSDGCLAWLAAQELERAKVVKKRLMELIQALEEMVQEMERDLDQALAMVQEMVQGKKK